MDIFIWLLAVFITNSFLSIAVSYVAASKGRSAGGFFFLSFFFSFLVGILVVLALPKLESKLVVVSESGSFGFKESEELFKCPYCAEWVKVEAKICRFCSKEIAQDIARLSAKDRKAQEAEQLAHEKQLKERIESAQEKQLQRKEKTSSFVKGPIPKRLFAGFVGLIVVVAVGFFVLSFLEKQQETERKSDWASLVRQCDSKKETWAPHNFGSALGDGYTINATNTELIFHVDVDFQYGEWIHCVGEKIAVDPPAGNIGGFEYKDYMGRFLWNEGISTNDFTSNPQLSLSYGNLDVLVEMEDVLYKLTIIPKN